VPRRKHPIEWTTEEALQKLFPPQFRRHLKKAVREAAEKAEKAEKSTKPKDTP
jgi:hypothetical protein